jgi:hypothetical protein
MRHFAEPSLSGYVRFGGAQRSTSDAGPRLQADDRLTADGRRIAPLNRVIPSRAKLESCVRIQVRFICVAADKCWRMSFDR